MYKYNEVRKSSEEVRCQIVGAFLGNLPDFQNSLNASVISWSGKTIDLMTQFLGITVDDLHNKTLEEIQILSAKIKKEASYLFHTDMYIKHVDIHAKVHKLFELIEPAIKILNDYVRNCRNYSFEPVGKPEFYILKSSIEIAEYRLPVENRTKQVKYYHAEFWYNAIRNSQTIELKKNMNRLLQQYEVLMGVKDDVLSEVDSVQMQAEDAFFEFYRQGGLNFSNDIDAMVRIFSVMTPDAVKRIISSPRFDYCVSEGGVRSMTKLLSRIANIQTDEDVLRYFLMTTPERVTDSLFSDFVNEKAGRPDSITNRQYARIISSLVAYLKNEGLMDFVPGSAVCFLIEHQPSLASDLFQSSARMLELRDTKSIDEHGQWNNWEKVILVALANCGVNDFNDKEVLMAVLHPDVKKMAMFSLDAIQRVYQSHKEQLPEWVASRIESFHNIAKDMQIIPVEADFNYSSERYVISQAQADALGRALITREIYYLDARRYLSNENTRPELMQWTHNFIISNNLSSRSHEHYRQYLLDHLEKLVNDEAEKFDFLSLKRLALALQVEYDFNIAHRAALNKLAVEFDNYVVKNHGSPEERETALRGVKGCYMRLHSESELNMQYKIWRFILRAAAAKLVFGKDVPTEMVVEDSAIYWLELGRESYEVYDQDLDYSAEEKMKRLSSLFFDFRQIYRFSKSLGGASVFIEVTKRILPGLMYIVDGKDIQKWETIQEALEQLNERRVWLLTHNNPLALTHYERTNVMDSAATIGNSILATLTNESTNGEVHGLSDARPSSKANGAAIIQGINDPWGALAHIVRNATSDSDLEKKYQVFNGLTQLKPSKKMSPFMLEALEIAWKYHFKVLCRMANKSDGNRPGFFRAILTATPCSKMSEIFSFKAIKNPKVSFMQLLQQAVQAFPDATEIEKIDTFYRCLAKAIGLDKAFNGIIDWIGIHLSDSSEIELNEYKKIVSSLREFASVQSYKGFFSLAENGDRLLARTGSNLTMSHI